jgi:hypothetical protein
MNAYPANIAAASCRAREEAATLVRTRRVNSTVIEESPRM